MKRSRISVHIQTQKKICIHRRGKVSDYTTHFVSHTYTHTHIHFNFFPKNFYLVLLFLQLTLMGLLTQYTYYFENNYRRNNIDFREKSLTFHFFFSF